MKNLLSSEFFLNIRIDALPSIIIAKCFSVLNCVHFEWLTRKLFILVLQLQQCWSVAIWKWVITSNKKKFCSYCTYTCLLLSAHFGSWILFPSHLLRYIHYVFCLSAVLAYGWSYLYLSQWPVPCISCFFEWPFGTVLLSHTRQEWLMSRAERMAPWVGSPRWAGVKYFMASHMTL